MKRIDLDTVSSTNTFLSSYEAPEKEDMILVTAEQQTAGRGQQGNTWESEARKNLLFSILVRPSTLPSARMFVLSEAIALSIREAIAHELSRGEMEEVCVKWPNDIYVGDCKIAGILIENTLAGQHIERSIIGCGVNILQRTFRFLKCQATKVERTDSQFTDSQMVPTPISLANIKPYTDTSMRERVLENIMRTFKRRYSEIQAGEYDGIYAEYLSHLYHREGLHGYCDANGTFLATIDGVEPDGHLLLRDSEGQQRRYAFKEVHLQA